MLLCCAPRWNDVHFSVLAGVRSLDFCVCALCVGESKESMPSPNFLSQRRGAPQARGFGPFSPSRGSGRGRGPVGGLGRAPGHRLGRGFGRASRRGEGSPSDPLSPAILQEGGPMLRKGFGPPSGPARKGLVPRGSVPSRGDSMRHNSFLLHDESTSHKGSPPLRKGFSPRHGPPSRRSDLMVREGHNRSLSGRVGPASFDEHVFPTGGPTRREGVGSEGSMSQKGKLPLRGRNEAMARGGPAPQRTRGQMLRGSGRISRSSIDPFPGARTPGSAPHQQQRISGPPDASSFSMGSPRNRRDFSRGTSIKF